MRHEVLQEALRVLRRAVADPLLDVELSDVAVRGGDADERRHRRADRRRVAEAIARHVVEVRRDRGHVGVEIRLQVAAADLVAVGVVPGGDQLRAGVRARRGYRGLRRRALNGEPASAGVLPVVGALGAHRADRRALALAAGGVLERVLRAVLGVDRGLALCAQSGDIRGRLDRVHGGIAQRGKPRLLLGRGDDRRLHVARIGLIQAVAEVEALIDQALRRRLVGQLDLEDGGVPVVLLCQRGRRRHQRNRRRRRERSHPWPHRPNPLVVDP